MARGIVTTARGLTLNLDDLIRKASMPLGKTEENSTKEKAAYRPRPENKPRLRGFVPTQGETTQAALKEAEKEPEKEKVSSTVIASSYAEDGKAKSLADLTGVKIEKTERMKAAAKEDAEEEAEEEEEVLGDLLKEMKAAPASSDEDEKKSTARRKKS